MAVDTKIEWTDHTWSPWEGCTKVSPACDHCYAARMNGWLKAGANWGPGAPRLEYSHEHWKKPERWNERAAKDGRRARVFPSVCDPFDNEVTTELRLSFFDVVRRTESLIWLLLTKRIGNVITMLRDAATYRLAEVLADTGDPLRDGLYQWLRAWMDGKAPANVHLGATVVTQGEYDRDIGKLLRTPARLHFLSVEPLLESIDMRLGGASMPDYSEHRPLAPLGWVICGGESGPGARPMHPDWARSLRDQCAAAGVPFMFKQWGEWAPYDRGRTDSAALAVPGSLDQPLRRFGKTISGRLLDGVEHNGFPA